MARDQRELRAVHVRNHDDNDYDYDHHYNDNYDNDYHNYNDNDGFMAFLDDGSYSRAREFPQWHKRSVANFALGRKQLG